MDAIDLLCLAVWVLSWTAAAYLAGRYASPRRHLHQTPGATEMSKVTDAFTAYGAYRDQKEAEAVAAAVAQERAAHQSEIDAAVDAAETADAATIAAAIPPAQ